MNKNIIDEVRATEIELNQLLKKFLPLNESKYWLETNNAQREIIHKAFAEYKKAVARLLLSSNIITDSDFQDAPEDWSKNFMQ